MLLFFLTEQSYRNYLIKERKSKRKLKRLKHRFWNLKNFLSFRASPVRGYVFFGFAPLFVDCRLAQLRMLTAQPPPPSLGGINFVRRVIEAVPQNTAARGRCREPLTVFLT